MKQPEFITATLESTQEFVCIGDNIFRISDIVRVALIRPKENEPKYEPRCVIILSGSAPLNGTEADFQYLRDLLIAGPAPNPTSPADAATRETAGSGAGDPIYSRSCGVNGAAPSGPSLESPGKAGGNSSENKK
ncbi:MAG: hypothetical protein LBV12_07125 [Puniceicoccales bacterium]|jgi:hypothetical protein|nr:hypothetical protein [Puniceicoccales bacterium]